MKKDVDPVKQLGDRHNSVHYETDFWNDADRRVRKLEQCFHFISVLTTHESTVNAHASCTLLLLWMFINRCVLSS